MAETRKCIRIASSALAWALLAIQQPLHAGDMDVSPEASKGCLTAVKPPAPRSREPVDAVKVVPPEQGAYAGLYTIGGAERDLRAFTAKAGYAPPIVFTFHDWISDSDFAKSDPHLRTFDDLLEGSDRSLLAFAEEVSRQGGIPAVAWAIQCCDWESKAWWFGLRSTKITLDRLIKGDFDAYIRKVAGQTKAFGKPLMLTLFSEFNVQGSFNFGPKGRDGIGGADHICSEYGDPGWPDGPERVRDAFMRVIDIFRAEGVRNVTWFMYAATNYMDPKHDYSPWLHPKYFYPGDDYIDWVGQSTYFVDPKWTFKVNDDGSDMVRALKPGYEAWGEVTQRPLFLPEFAALGLPDTDRSAILRTALRDFLPTLPRVKALTLADFLIAEQCCQVPRLGGRHAGEIEAWRESVGRDPRYEKRPRTGRPAPAGVQPRQP